MFLLLAACDSHAGTHTLVVDGHEIRVEVVDEPVERNVGLMYRESMGADHGMLFVYPDEDQRSFWMKNTKIPLTIAYIDAKGTIVHIADMTPLDTSSVPSTKPAMYALEMNQGWYAKNEVAVGDTITGLPKPSER